MFEASKQIHGALIKKQNKTKQAHNENKIAYTPQMQSDPKAAFVWCRTFKWKSRNAIQFLVSLLMQTLFRHSLIDTNTVSSFLHTPMLIHA